MKNHTKEVDFGHSINNLEVNRNFDLDLKSSDYLLLGGYLVLVFPFVVCKRISRNASLSFGRKDRDNKAHNTQALSLREVLSSAFRIF